MFGLMDERDKVDHTVDVIYSVLDTLEEAISDEDWEMVDTAKSQLERLLAELEEEDDDD